MASRAGVQVEVGAKTGQFTSAMKRLQQELNKVTKGELALKRSFDKGTITLDKFEKEMRSLEKRSKTARKALSSFNKESTRFTTRGGKRGRGSTSSNAGFAIQELGRGIADFNSAGGFTNLNQGLRGATNNLERFAEISLDTVRQSGGVKEAFKAMGKSLLGAGGLILGITILLQFLPQIIKFFKTLRGTAAKTKDEINKLSKELSELRKSYFGDSKASVEDQILAKWDEIIEKQDKYIKILKNPPKVDNTGTASFGNRQIFSIPGSTGFDELQQTVNKFGRDRDASAIKEKQDIAAANKLYDDQMSSIKRKLEIAKSTGVEGDDLLRLEQRLLMTIKTENVELERQISLKHRLAILNNTLNFGDTPQVSSVNALTPAGVDGSFAPGITTGNFADLIQSEAFKKNAQGYDEYLAKMSEVEAKNKLVTDSFKTLGNNIAQALTQSHGVAGAFFGTMIQGLLDLAAQSITSAAVTSTTEAAKQGAYGATATAAAVAGAAEGAAAGGPAAPVLLPIFIAAALAAIGAALSGTGGSRGSGGRGRSSGSARASVTPTSVQGGGGNRNGGAIGVIRGNQIRYINQVEADSYSGRN